jgi:hypothetical protein
MSGLESMSTLVPLLVSSEVVKPIKDATRHFLVSQQRLSRRSSYKEEKTLAQCRCGDTRYKPLLRLNAWLRQLAKVSCFLMIVA